MKLKRIKRVKTVVPCTLHVYTWKCTVFTGWIRKDFYVCRMCFYAGVLLNQFFEVSRSNQLHKTHTYTIQQQTLRGMWSTTANIEKQFVADFSVSLTVFFSFTFSPFSLCVCLYSVFIYICWLRLPLPRNDAIEFRFLKTSNLNFDMNRAEKKTTWKK